MTSKNMKDLFNQMKTKKIIDPNTILSDLPSNNLSDDEKSNHSNNSKKSNKSPNKLTEQLDYYLILGIKKDANALEIKRAYHQKLKMYHPDKVEQTKENKAKYKLIKEAGELLTNETNRKVYDMERHVVKTNKDFVSQKHDFDEFVKLQQANDTEDNRKVAKLNFENMRKDLDRKHGYVETDIALTAEESKRRMEDMMLQREQEELEIHHKNIFEGKKYDPIAFNKYFEKRKNKTSKSDSLVKHNDVAAFNDGSEFSNTMGAGNAYDDLYGEGKFNDYNANYAGIDNGLIGTGDDDSISIGSSDPEDNYNTHNKNKGTVDDLMKKLMSQRENDDKLFENMTDVDFKSALDDKYGVSNGLGFLVGNSTYGNQKNTKTKFTNDELKAYKALLGDKK